MYSLPEAIGLSNKFQDMCFVRQLVKKRSRHDLVAGGVAAVVDRRGPESFVFDLRAGVTAPGYNFPLAVLNRCPRLAFYNCSPWP